MAFGTALNADDEEQKKQDQTNLFTGGSAPGAAGGMASGGGLAAGFNGGSAAAPSKTQAQGGGSGFVNLGRYFDNATADNAGKLSGAVNTAISTEKGAFDKAADPLRKASTTFGNAPTQDQINNAIGSADDRATHYYGDSTKDGNDYQLGQWLKTKYDGPTKVDYTPDTNNFTNISKLVGADTGFDAAYGQGASGSLGNSMLDQALFRSDPRVAQARAAATNDTKAFIGNADKEMTDLNAKGSGFAKQASDIRDSVKGALQTRFDKYLGNINNRLANTKEDEAKRRLASQGRDYVDPSNLTLRGIADPNEWANFSRLSKMLGTDNPLGNGERGNYQTGESGLYGAGYAKSGYNGIKTGLDSTGQVGQVDPVTGVVDPAADSADTTKKKDRNATRHSGG